MSRHLRVVMIFSDGSTYSWIAKGNRTEGVVDEAVRICNENGWPVSSVATLEREWVDHVEIEDGDLEFGAALWSEFKVNPTRENAAALEEWMTNG